MKNGEFSELDTAWRKWYYVTATHPHKDYRFERTPVRVGWCEEIDHEDFNPIEGPARYKVFYADHPVLGCGKDRPSPEEAICYLFEDHGCTVTLIESK